MNNSNTTNSLSYPVVFGLASTVLSSEEKKIFQEYPPYGFILFKRNIESSDQVKQLIISLRQLFPSRDIKIFVDQEGGRVARIRPPIIDNAYPAAATFGEIYQEDPENAKTLVYENYKNLMHDLKILGIDSPCAPVCDLYYKFAHDVIGDRSFSSSTDIVIDLANAAIDGIKASGGIPLIKHVPGHGRAISDSHSDLPRITDTIDDLKITDFKVFKALATSHPGIMAMTAHIVFDAIDDKPITTSSKGIKYIKENIAPNAVLISDDICMSALHGMIANQYKCLKEIVNVTKNTYVQLDIEVFKTLFPQYDEEIAKKEIFEFAYNNFDSTQKKYLANLVFVTKLTMQAGCDILLHCNGDIDEMQIVCQTMKKLQDDNL